MSNLDPQTPYQPWSQKLQNLIDVSDDIVTMMSGTDDARLLALVANSSTIGVTLPTGIATGLSATGIATDHISLAGTYSNAIKIGGVAGVGLYINKTANTAATIKAHCHQLAADGVDAPNFVANEFKGEFLSTGTSNATMDGIASHFHMAASTTGIMRAILGVAYLDTGKTLSGTDYTNSGWLAGGVFSATAAGTVNGTGVCIVGVLGQIGSCQGGTLTNVKYIASLWGDSARVTTSSGGISALCLLTTNSTGAAVDYAIDVVNGAGTGGIGSIMNVSGIVHVGIDFTSATPTYGAYTTAGTGGRNNPFIKIGSWDDPLTIVQTTDHWVPIQVNIKKSGNIASDTAAMRLRVDTNGAQALSAFCVGQIRSSVAHNVASIGTFGAGLSIDGNITIGSGETVCGGFSIAGSGTVTAAGSNKCTVLQACNWNTSATESVTHVAHFFQNGAASTVRALLQLESIAGTATAGLVIPRGTGTLYTAIRVGDWVGSAATGSAIPFATGMNKYNDGQLDVIAAFGESSSDLTGAYSAKVARFRHLVNGITCNHESYGAIGQLVAKDVSFGHYHSGLMGTFEINTAATVLTSYGCASIIGRIGGSGCTVNSGGLLAGVLSLQHQSAFTNNGTLAAFAATKTSTGIAWPIGLYLDTVACTVPIQLGVDADGVPVVIVVGNFADGAASGYGHGSLGLDTTDGLLFVADTGKLWQQVTV